MSDYRTDSYQEMKALLQDRLDSIVAMDEEPEQQESGLKKWGKRAAVGALGAGLTVAGAHGAKRGLYALAKKNKGNTFLRSASQTAKRIAHPIRTGRAFARNRRKTTM